MRTPLLTSQNGLLTTPSFPTILITVSSMPSTFRRRLPNGPGTSVRKRAVRRISTESQPTTRCTKWKSPLSTPSRTLLHRLPSSQSRLLPLHQSKRLKMTLLENWFPKSVLLSTTCRSCNCPCVCPISVLQTVLSTAR